MGEHLNPTELTDEEKIRNTKNEIFDHVYPRIKILEDQVKDLQQLIINLKTYPPLLLAQPIYPTTPPYQPYIPPPYPSYPYPVYPWPTTVICTNNTSEIT